MKPYFEDEHVTIYHGDCRNAEFRNIDAIITDPPFFMPAAHYQSRITWQRSWGDAAVLGTFWRSMMATLTPALKATGHFIVFCNGDSYPVFYPEMYGKFDTLKCLVWNKAHIGLGRIWRHQHELIIAARWQESFVNKCDKLRTDVITVPVTPFGERDHPVEKPTSLLCHLIEPVTPHGGLILDPFMGAGSTLLAARRLGKRAIGIEIEERYCEIAARRMAQEVLSFEAPAVELSAAALFE
jgi:site-specific DNA-methyltransferase (adenine-specific)